MGPEIDVDKPAKGKQPSYDSLYLKPKHAQERQTVGGESEDDEHFDVI